MSSSMGIPTRSAYGESSKAGASSSSSSSSYSSSPQTPQQQKSTPPGSSTKQSGHNRRPSLLSSSFSKQEHTVVNIGDPDGDTLRLITCVRSSQGFDWNPEIFLPSYVECDFESLERKRDPVHEILVSDEEIKNMFPS